MCMARTAGCSRPGSSVWAWGRSPWPPRWQPPPPYQGRASAGGVWRSGASACCSLAVAFVALPVAALCLAWSFRRDPQWRPCAGVLLALALAAAVSLLAFMASLAPVFVSPGPPTLLGITQRILLAVYAAWLGVVAIGLLRASQARVAEPDSALSRGLC